MKKRVVKALLSASLSLALVFGCLTPVQAKQNTPDAVAAAETEVKSFTVSIPLDPLYVDKYGKLIPPPDQVSKKDFLDAGYQYGDLVKVSFLDQELIIPFGSAYSDVDSGAPVLVGREKDEFLILLINNGDFATEYHLAEKETHEDGSVSWTPAEGVEWPIAFTISMEEPGGYKDEYDARHLPPFSNDFKDYPDLSADEFANFRAISTRGIREGVLYRTSTPLDPSIGRSAYADAALQLVGVTVIMNLADDETTLHSYEGVEDTYAIKQKIIPLNLSVDVTADDFKEKIAKGLRFFAENKGVYAIHCKEGTNRAGIVSAILELFMGASLEEVTGDFMTSYYNYYGIGVDDRRYDKIIDANLTKTLQKAFEIEDLTNIDLQAEAEEYIRSTGLTDEEISALRDNLGIDDILAAMDDLKGKFTPKKGKIKVTMTCKDPTDVFYTVEVINKKTGKPVKNETEETGSFILKGLKKGKYTVNVTACMDYNHQTYFGDTITKTVKVK